MLILRFNTALNFDILLLMYNVIDTRIRMYSYDNFQTNSIKNVHNYLIKTATYRHIQA